MADIRNKNTFGFISSFGMLFGELKCFFILFALCDIEHRADRTNNASLFAVKMFTPFNDIAYHTVRTNNAVFDLVGLVDGYGVAVGCSDRFSVFGIDTLHKGLVGGFKLLRTQTENTKCLIRPAELITHKVQIPVSDVAQLLGFFQDLHAFFCAGDVFDTAHDQRLSRGALHHYTAQSNKNTVSACVKILFGIGAIVLRVLQLFELRLVLIEIFARGEIPIEQCS